MTNRKVTYRLYANKKQTERLSDMLALHQRVYNAAALKKVSGQELVEGGSRRGFAMLNHETHAIS